MIPTPSPLRVLPLIEEGELFYIPPLEEDIA